MTVEVRYSNRPHALEVRVRVRVRARVRVRLTLTSIEPLYLTFIYAGQAQGRIAQAGGPPVARVVGQSSLECPHARRCPTAASPVRCASQYSVDSYARGCMTVTPVADTEHVAPPSDRKLNERVCCLGTSIGGLNDQ